MSVKAIRTANDFRVTVQARQHQFTADVETEKGGGDTAPTPHDYLAASLAACTSMTVQMYADRKKWPLKSCDVTVSLAVEGDSKDPKSSTLFDVRLTFQGELDLDQRKRLLEIASHCPVHRALTRPIAIRMSEDPAG